MTTPYWQLVLDQHTVVGCDEAGAGCGASDLVVAGVVLDPKHPIHGLRDSKQLSHLQRERLYDEIVQHAAWWGVVHVSPQEIDQINILQARMKGFFDVLEKEHGATHGLIDGNRGPNNTRVPYTLIVKGDDLVDCIKAASIVAKVTRDRLMLAQHAQYPMYGFDQHKGYLTKQHLTALKQHGPSPIHRMSYKPVKSCILEQTD